MKPNEQEFSENILAIIANYLWLTDWLQFMFVSTTTHSYFSQNEALWAQYELDPSFCPPGITFRNLSTKEQCVSLEALRKARTPDIFWERLLKLDPSVASMCILRYAGASARNLEEMSDPFSYCDRLIQPGDHVLGVGRAIGDRTYLWPVVLRRYRLFTPQIMRQRIAGQYFELPPCMDEWVSLSNLVAELRMVLMTLPFSRKP
jgi:hypothetical protein